MFKDLFPEMEVSMWLTMVKLAEPFGGFLFTGEARGFLQYLG